MKLFTLRKKTFSLFLVFAMVLTLATPALAAKNYPVSIPFKVLYIDPSADGGYRTQDPAVSVDCICVKNERHGGDHHISLASLAAITGSDLNLESGYALTGGFTKEESAEPELIKDDEVNSTPSFKYPKGATLYAIATAIPTATVTFKIAGGTWDGVSDKADKTATVVLSDVSGTKKGTLEATQIPNVTSAAPSEGYETPGAWVPAPDTSENGITEAGATYIYTFTKIPAPQTATVIFKIENGTWENNTTTDIEVPITLDEYGKGTLDINDVPTGMKPNSFYTAGAWKPEPDTSTGGITEDVTYTYSYTPEELPTEYTVTYKDGASTVHVDNVPIGDSTTAHAALTKEGFDFMGWSLTDGGPVAYAPGATITSKGDMTLYASWNPVEGPGPDPEPQPEYCYIQATATAGGNISPWAGTIRVEKYGNKSFTFTAAPGYVLTDVLVDGVSVGAVKTYSFANVTRNHTIHGVFSTGSEIPLGPPPTGSNPGTALYFGAAAALAAMALVSVLFRRRRKN